jgi:hypothetical protein
LLSETANHDVAPNIIEMVRNPDLLPPLQLTGFSAPTTADAVIVK